MKPAPKNKRPVGRPIEKPWPDQIPDTPENVAKALVRAKPRKASVVSLG